MFQRGWPGVCRQCKQYGKVTQQRQGLLATLRTRLSRNDINLEGQGMNLNASIIDQRLAGVQAEIATRAADELNLHDPGRLKSLAFVYLCVQNPAGPGHGAGL